MQWAFSSSRSAAVKYRIQAGSSSVRDRSSAASAGRRAALADLAADDLRWVTTFVSVDPYAAQIEWRTLEKLARHKHRSKFKVELWML
jgi:hypothetical protein